MPTLAAPIAIARERAGVDSNALTDQMCIDYANVASFKMKKMLIDRGIDACPVQEVTRGVTDNVGTYLYPSDMFYIPKNMEINWFESTPGQDNYKQVDKLTDVNIPPEQSISWLRNNQPHGSPLVDYRGDYFEIFPTPKASFWSGTSGSTSNTAAMRLFYYLMPTASSTSSILYTATTDTMTYPESQDHFQFADLIRATYQNSIGKMNDADYEAFFDKEVNKLVHIIQGEGLMPTRPKGLNLTGWEY